MLDHITEEKSKFGIPSYLGVSHYQKLNFSSKTYENAHINMQRYSEGGNKMLASFVCQDKILELKFNANSKPVLFRMVHRLSLEEFWQTLTQLLQICQVCKAAVKKNVVKYKRSSTSENILFILLDSKFLMVSSGTKLGGRTMLPKNMIVKISLQKKCLLI